MLSVSARDGANGTEVTTTLWYTITAAPLLTAVSVSASPNAPQPVYTTITLSASATGGVYVQYQFWLYNPATTPAWIQLHAYSTWSTCTWTPTAPGNYFISATARDGINGTEVNNSLWYTISVATPLTMVTVTASKASPQPVNTPITFTATATGGTQVQYQFWLYNPNATPAWSQLQAYSAQAACTWTPVVAGQYQISITAKDGVSGTK